MPGPESFVQPVLDCLGVSVSISVPQVVIPLPGVGLPGVGLPGVGVGIGIPDPMVAQLPSLGVPIIVIPGMDYKFEWPTIDMPGLPTIVAGFAGSMLAGLNYALDFLPPNPENLPSLPTIDLFVGGFTGAAVGLPGIPATEINIPGVPSIPFPGMPGAQIPGFNPNAMLNLIGMMIASPFLIFEGIITSIIDLNLQIPSLQMILDILKEIAISIGMPIATMEILLPCLSKMAKAVVDLLA